MSYLGLGDGDIEWEAPPGPILQRSDTRSCNCYPHGPDDPCTCTGCWACAGGVVGCTCDIDWSCEHG